jgi:sterol desaturase/sphingolipid hydroxylase (fatty acid hydroxylase superfamily)
MIENALQKDVGAWRAWVTFLWLVILLLWESFSPFLPLFSSAKTRVRHGLINIFVGLINALLTATIFAGLWKGAADLAARHHWGVLRVLSLPSALHGLAALLLLDIWTYWWHRANHRIPFLWRFHRAHHSDSRMDVTTANRFHAGEIFLSSLLRLLLIPLLGIRFGDLVIYETLLQIAVQWQHANIGFSSRTESRLRTLLVTPGMHKVHHSRKQPETDSNYASFLSVWDRLFRSFRHHPKPDSIRYGLEGWDSPEKQTATGVLKQPFQ